jgi:hypothetical protein
MVSNNKFGGLEVDVQGGSLYSCTRCEGFLEQPDKVLVSAEEVKVVVKLHGVRHMICNKVIESTQSPREPGSIRLWGQFHETLHGGGVLNSLRFAKVAPVIYISTAKGKKEL